MAVKKRDPLTGHQTTGHEWNGISELNTRVPRIVWWAIGITHLYALLAWLVLPSWPWINTYWQGLWGIDQREQLAAAIVAGQVERQIWQPSIVELPLDGVLNNTELMGVVRVTGPALYGDHCAACHGTFATGGPGFPDLTDNAWLWGGDPETIYETIRVGINTLHPESRFAQMPAFGDGILSTGEIHNLVNYVRSLSKLESNPVRAAAGEPLFMDNCSACHGDDGRGNMDIGAPDLTDNAWVYGASNEILFRTIRDGRMGFMPGWETRLSEAELRILTLFVIDLGHQREAAELTEVEQ